MTADPSYQGDVSMFSVGTVLARSFSTFFKHPFVFLALSFLSQVPGIVIMVLARNPVTVLQVVSIINGVFGLAIQGAIAYGVYEVFRGYAAPLGKSLSRGMARLIPLIFAVLACSVVFILIGIGCLLLVYMLKVFLPSLIMILIGLPIFALWCKWSVFVPACVVERLGPIESLSRSSVLTKGCRLKISGLYLLCFAIMYVASLIFSFIAGALVVWLMKILGVTLGIVFFVVIQQLILAVPAAFIHVVTAVIYYGLRESKEGVDIEHLVNVFD